MTDTEPRTALRTVVLPSEHGGWSLTAEPVLLGLVVAWSSAGLALGLAAMLAFVARTPLKVVLVDRWRGRRLERTELALRVLAVEMVALLVLAGYALSAGDAGFWLPLACAAPLVVLELWFDMRSRSRRLLPELAGSIGIGSVAAAIALAGGEPTRLAWGLWAVLAIRSIAAIPYVRTQIHRAKSQPALVWHSDLAQVVAVVAATAGWVADLVPGAAAIVIALVGVANVVAVRLAPRRAVVIGIEQTIVGLVVIAATSVAVLSG